MDLIGVVERRRARRLRQANAKLAPFFAIMLFRWQQNKLKERKRLASDQIVEFLNDVQSQQFADFTKIMKHWRNLVIRCQRNVRHFLKTRRARREMLTRLWHKIEHDNKVANKIGVVHRVRSNEKNQIEMRSNVGLEEREARLAIIMRDAVLKFIELNNRFIVKKRIANTAFKKSSAADAQALLRTGKNFLERDDKVPEPPTFTLYSAVKGVIEQEIEEYWAKKQVEADEKVIGGDLMYIADSAIGDLILTKLHVDLTSDVVNAHLNRAEDGAEDKAAAATAALDDLHAGKGPMSPLKSPRSPMKSPQRSPQKSPQKKSQNPGF